MKLASALLGLAALGDTALVSTGSLAMPVGVPSWSAANIEHVGYICDVSGHCWWRPYYGYYGVPAYSGTYFVPHYDGGSQYRRGSRRWHSQAAIQQPLVG